MSFVRFPLRTIALATAATAQAFCASAQTTSTAPTAATAGSLPPVTVEASADASAEGLTKPYAGGQVARGGRVGILGNQDMMSTPFSTTSYTNELIQDQQAQSVADVLLNAASVRRAASATSRSCTWCMASRSFRTTLPTTACMACCLGNTSPPNSLSASKSSWAPTPF
ncbi:MAG TPA: hypothetical protein VLJ19_15885 [Variovorax sp.]|nr:hypothetical protein [Variovorax sp.]